MVTMPIYPEISHKRCKTLSSKKHWLNARTEVAAALMEAGDEYADQIREVEAARPKNA
jgi:hypothetical protein